MNLLPILQQFLKLRFHVEILSYRNRHHYTLLNIVIIEVMDISVIEFLKLQLPITYATNPKMIGVEMYLK